MSGRARRRWRWFAAIAAVAVAVLAAAAPAAGQVPGEPWRVYVTNMSDGMVSVIDTATNTVTATVTVGDGPIGLAVSPDQAPVARLTIDPAPAGQATTFDASASTVQFGEIATYAWDFGDGTTAATTTPTTTHIYATPRNCPVRLTLTSSGGTSTAQVFTGQTTSRNGGPQATTTIPAAGGGGGGGGEGGLPVTGAPITTGVIAGLLATAVGVALLLSRRHLHR